MIDLDHLLWASPDLDRGTAEVAALTGVAPAIGGSHPGFGTRNSLLSLGGTYLEIIAPDPEQPLDGNRGGRIAALPRPGLLTFAVRTSDLAGYAAAARRAGLAIEGPVEMSRTRPDGVRLSWACLYALDERFGDAIPFAIDWRQSPHPAATTPPGCRLLDFVALHPDPAALSALYETLGLSIAVKGGVAPGLLATLQTPKGDVVLIGP